ncbi:hypothetical protein Q2T83_14005 [Fervidibacter sacchari]|uniref:hypothetical protein n=1 Tax=Candidatus Fervidibacter sacchari TaxID=1448929 RepID=UPI00216714F1|nr:hypothetical protein [Candidatus Fervidibacter sacchari]WKU15436.1 hypothetical protein Q2T83_14005 [Candidatus Fervidibacter sacchari]
MSVQKCLNLPLTHNSQPATLNLPFYCPLKVGSGLAQALHEARIRRTSPSPQGRVGTAEGAEIVYAERRSPSPQGRVKLSCGLSVES